MNDDRIEGFMVGGTTALTVASEGGAISLSLNRRTMERPLEVTLSADQSARLRRLLSAAEKRAR